jgi:putative nucleotide binding protein
MEDFAYIVDYLPQGRPDSRKFHKEPLAFALGETEFKLFELVPKPNIVLTIEDRVYIGKEIERREQILHVKRRIGFEELTVTAQTELPFVITRIVEKNEERFIRFYNEAQAITTRFNMLELLPGLGKKTMWTIIEERKKGPFTTFKNFEERTGIKNPQKLIAKRIEQELAEADEKYLIFVAK